MAEKKREVVFVVSLFVLMISRVGLSIGDAHDGHKIKGIRLERCLTVGSLDDDLLFQWVGVSTDSLGHIYVTDSMDYSLKKFDSNGKLLKKSGGKGQGPGEFMAPRLLDSSLKYLYVTDQLVPGIQVFDNELVFVRRIPIKTPIIDLKILTDDKIAVAPFLTKRPSELWILDKDGNQKNVFTFNQDREDLMMDQFSVDFDGLKNFYVAYTFQDRIEKFNSDGEKIWTRKLLGQPKIKRKEISGYILPSEITYKDVEMDSHGNVYILGGHFSTHPSRDVYVLDSDGNWFSTLTLPDTSHCIHIDESDHIFSRANAGVTLYKFKIHFRFKLDKNNPL